MQCVVITILDLLCNVLWWSIRWMCIAVCYIFRFYVGCISLCAVVVIIMSDL